MAAEEPVRTAVVIVHGMGEKRPMETFDGFVRTALDPHDGKWDYHPQSGGDHRHLRSAPMTRAPQTLNSSSTTGRS